MKRNQMNENEMSNNCKSPETCLITKTCVPCAICSNTKNKNDSLALIAEKHEKIKILHAEIKSLRHDICRMDTKHAELRKNNEEQSKLGNLDILKLGDEWKLIEESGFSTREIVALQHVVGGFTLRELAELIGVTADRVAKIRDKALRKLRHPKRTGLAAKFNPKLYRAVHGGF